MSWSFSVRKPSVAEALEETNAKLERQAANIPENVQGLIRGSVATLAEMAGYDVSLDTWGHIGSGTESLKIEVKHTTRPAAPPA